MTDVKLPKRQVYYCNVYKNDDELLLPCPSRKYSDGLHMIGNVTRCVEFNTLTTGVAMQMPKFLNSDGQSTLDSLSARKT